MGITTLSASTLNLILFLLLSLSSLSSSTSFLKPQDLPNHRPPYNSLNMTGAKRPRSGTAAPSKRLKAADEPVEADSWPESVWCEKCMKHTIIAPGHTCETHPGSRVCITCQKGSDTCEKVSSMPSIRNLTAKVA